MNPEKGGALYPRISREMMRNFVNQYATVVGRVQNISGTKMTILTADNDKATVTVENFRQDIEDDTQPATVEVRGLVSGPSTIKMEDYNSFGDSSFDLDSYNQMLNYYHSQKYNAMTTN
eukprot:CAMPEP_0176425762 /NCGR_PEP_ID=MMETSP0127-20121128/11564_1 /TAXON_ID=938130 /ORGANISM="Platyophrya macrostoma, Strain WH" /LENGTH=118 /DNA_ID=CAMNT_0017806949 /DNA_START=35 /DNA_END=391 /DNA_ORIENTATION=+